jgi:hypothetical protein
MRCQPAYKGRLAGWHVGQQEGGTGLLHPKRLARTHSHGFRTPAVRAAYRTYSPFWYLPGGGKFRQIPCSHPARPSRLPTPPPPPPPPPRVPPLPTVALDFGGGTALIATFVRWILYFHSTGCTRARGKGPTGLGWEGEGGG